MPEPVEDAFDPGTIERLRNRMLSPVGMRAYFAAKLPLALFAGLRIRDLTRQRCAVAVPYGWRTQNPFRSTYFAAQTMAAELSTGAPALLAVQAAPASIAMLLVQMQATFGKKAADTAVFTCEQGQALFEAVAETMRTGEPATAEVETVGRLPDGTEIAHFHFTWSFKRRTERG